MILDGGRFALLFATNYYGFKRLYLMYIRFVKESQPNSHGLS